LRNPGHRRGAGAWLGWAVESIQRFRDGAAWEFV
jgi:hypothetical protein